MATVRITINGVICDLYGRTITGPVKIVGEAMYTDLGVGGGPMPPGPGGGGGGPVDPGYGYPETPVDPGYGIPEGGPPRPAHPIYDPPRPAHPIVLPPDRPTDPPTEPPTNPADPTWQWGWNRAQGWHPVYVPGPSDPGPH